MSFIAKKPTNILFTLSIYRLAERLQSESTNQAIVRFNDVARMAGFGVFHGKGVGSEAGSTNLLSRLFTYIKYQSVLPTTLKALCTHQVRYIIYIRTQGFECARRLG